MSTAPVAYMNGEWIPRSEARISIDDRGFLFGDCLYDVVSAWDGLIFRLEAHLDRIIGSMRAAGIASPLTREEWHDIVIECVRRNELRNASIRLMVTRGLPAPPAGDPPDYIDLRSFVPDHSPTIIVTAAPYYFLAEREAREQGIRLWISHLRALSPDTLDPRYKSQSRLHMQLARSEAMAAGADDVIWLDQLGYVSEGAASNVFAIIGGELYTPRAYILRGITRMTIVELAERLGIPAHERDITAFDLFTADEVFTASTGGGILPVREISGHHLPEPVPGVVTRRLDEAYWKMRRSGEYCTPVYGGEAGVGEEPVAMTTASEEGSS